MTEKQKESGPFLSILILPFVLLIVLVWGAFWVVLYPFRLAYEYWLKFRFWQRHGKHGRFVLLIYSDSPNWKDYIEVNILPRLEPHVVTLNWSERQEWHRSNPFEARLFHHWAGDTDFNPMAIVFAPTGEVREVRFWKAFKDSKHGKDRLLKQAESFLFSEVERIASQAT